MVHREREGQQEKRSKKANALQSHRCAAFSLTTTTTPGQVRGRRRGVVLLRVVGVVVLVCGFHTPYPTPNKKFLDITTAHPMALYKIMAVRVECMNVSK